MLFIEYTDSSIRKSTILEKNNKYRTFLRGIFKKTKGCLTMEIRKVKVSDYHLISSSINNWWDGRRISDMLPKLFVVHFADTSFIAEENGEIIGFLIGFLSQTDEDAAYIHFVGVEPNHRQRQIGKSLYHEFFYSN